MLSIFLFLLRLHTHAGNKKEMIFANNWERYSKYIDKIVYIAVNDMPNNGDSWTNENFHRNAIARSFHMFDKDEIPRNSAVSLTRSLNLPTRFDLDFYNYNFNCFIDNVVWRQGTLAYRLGDITTSVQECQVNPTKFSITNAGWHFSWFGDKEFCVNKIKNFAHQELNTEEIITNFPKNFDGNKEYYMSRTSFNFTTKPIDSTLPIAVTTHKFPFIEKYINTH